MSTPVISYASSVQTNCLASGMPRIKFPLPSESASVQFAAYAFDQDFEQRVDQFPPAGKNTLASASPFSLPSFTSSILTNLSQPQNTWGMNVKYTGTFQIVPATWNDVKSMPFTFPGFPGLIGQTGSRDPFTDNVDVRLQYDYYVLDPANLMGCGTAPTAGGGVQTSATINDSGGNAVKCVYDLVDIPLITKTFFVVAYGGTPDYTNRTNSLTPSGGVSVNGVAWFQSLPTKAHYQSWISQVATYSWQGKVWDGTTDAANDGSSGAGHSFTQLVSDDSKIQLFAGNIIERITSFVLAK